MNGYELDTTIKLRRLENGVITFVFYYSQNNELRELYMTDYLLHDYFYFNFYSDFTQFDVESHPSPCS